MHGKNLHAHSHKFRQCKDTRNTSKIHANPLLAGDVPDGFLTNSIPCKNSNKHFNIKVRLFFSTYPDNTSLSLCLSRCHRQLRWHILAYSLFLIFKRVLCSCFYLGASKNQYVTYFLATEVNVAFQGSLLFILILVFSITPGLTPLSGYFSQTPFLLCLPLDRNPQGVLVGSSL